MCTTNSDCTGGAKCVNGKCQGGSNPPTEPPPVPPIAEETRIKKNDEES